MSRLPSLDQWTDRALRQCLKIFEKDDCVKITSAEMCVMRGQLRDLLKERRARQIMRRKAGIVID